MKSGKSKNANKRPKTVMEHISENTETIVIAVILAVLVRAFVLEAFQIPTGSMAPGLCGVHMHVECPNCGWGYNVGGTQADYGLTSHGQADEGLRAMPCPLCDQTPGVGDVKRRVGDHIFVNKVLYQTRDPKRWEVFVFKYPGSISDPTDRNHELNFIKRCIGLPGDRLQIVDGDVFNHGEILRKSPSAQRALWFPLYDSGYPWTIQVRGQPAWRTMGGKSVTFPTAKEPGRIRIEGGGPNDSATLVFNRDLDDRCIYNGYREQTVVNIVSDVALAFTLVPGQAAGIVEVLLDADKAPGRSPWRPPHRGGEEPDGGIPPHRQLRLTLDLAAGRGWLKLGVSETGAGSRQVFDFEVAPGTPLQVRLENVDYLATVTLAGGEVASLDYWKGQSVEVDALRRDDVMPGGRPRVGRPRLTVRGVDAELPDLKLWRDIYYTNRSSSGPLIGQSGEDIVLRAPGERIVFSDKSTSVSSGEFFALGDNSASSRDSRMWGPVPRENVLGRAMIVWPWLYSTRLKVIR